MNEDVYDLKKGQPFFNSKGLLPFSLLYTKASPMALKPESYLKETVSPIIGES
jgi:hypothetical protein